jgi:hypothetical protein
MSCAGCGQSRQQFFTAVRTGDMRGVARAIGTAINLNVDKLRGVEVDRKYGRSKTPIVEGRPYRRDPDRTV